MVAAMVKHKLSCDSLHKKEVVLCTGTPDRREQVRYFWKNVTCPKCRAKQKKRK